MGGCHHAAMEGGEKNVTGLGACQAKEASDHIPVPARAVTEPKEMS